MRLYDPTEHADDHIRRYSSREKALNHSFLRDAIRHAKRYDRIAGYFSSSIFELAGEDLESLKKVRIVCNTDIQQNDWIVAQNREALLLGSLSADPAADARLNRRRYRLLARFLDAHPDAIRVVPDHICGFVHGKAGVIEGEDGSRVSFIGSMNETIQGWSRNYEILWADTSAAGANWTQAEFDYLWRNGKPLPEAVINEIKRRARSEAVEDLTELEEDELGPAAFVESPLYCQGASLTDWQIRFVDIVRKHYREFGCARLLLADEVGLGKTFSLAAAVVTLFLLEQRRRTFHQESDPEHPIVIFAPSTLTRQWQAELHEYLAIPVARWDVNKKLWAGLNDVALTPRDVSAIGVCPTRISIVPTSVFTHGTEEAEILRAITHFETIVLDESHKARWKPTGGRDTEPNQLLEAMHGLAAKSTNVLLGTATPMQLSERDLWGQFSILQQGRGSFIFREGTSDWARPSRVSHVIRTGNVSDYDQAWRLISSYVPSPGFLDEPPEEETAHRSMWSAYSSLLRGLGEHMPSVGCRRYRWALDPNDASTASISDEPDIRPLVEDLMSIRVGEVSFFQAYNPIISHTVLRKRKELEDQGKLQRIKVCLHPDFDDPDTRHHDRLRAYFSNESGLSYGIRAYEHFDVVYEAAQTFTRLHAGHKGGILLGHILLKRICSSPHAGLTTARRILEGRADEILSEEDLEAGLASAKKLPLSVEARDVLQTLTESLSAAIESGEYEDRKLEIINIYLSDLDWVRHGCILFSQYLDTAEWVARYLIEKKKLDYRIGLYAGGSKSRLYWGCGRSQGVSQNDLKQMVQKGEIDLLVATDSACEGLNLQRMRSIINVDLPWNPVKLQQRIGRVKRVGQKSDQVNALNLIYRNTLDEAIYDRLSRRLKDQHDFFGSVPDFFETDWTKEEMKILEEMEEKLNKTIRNSFDLHYNFHTQPKAKDWRSCHKVLPRQYLHSLLIKKDALDHMAAHAWFR